MVYSSCLIKADFTKLLYIGLLISISILNPTQSFSQIIVNFTVDQTDGCAPYIVQFKNLTENNDNYNYVWDLGNGNTSVLRNPTATYATAGSYTISLTVYNNNESEILTKSNYINVFNPPSVDFSVNGAHEGCTPLSIEYTSTITPETSGNSFTWDFGDGMISNEKNPIHNYETPGIFNVTFISEDNHGCISKATYENLITAQKPTAIFESSEKLSCNGSLTSEFKNQSYGLGTLEYKWNFGDKESSGEINPIHLFTEAGNYSVSLNVTDNLGCKDSLLRENYIDITNTMASFAFDRDTVCINELIQFTNNSINNRKNEWLFGDGQVSSETNPSHRYSSPGLYTIRLNIENYTCNSAIEKQIYVEDVMADFSVSDSFSCKAPINIQYQSSGKNIESYNWKFGNGTTSSQANPINTFELNDYLKKNGKQTYTDTLIVVSIHGCTNKIIKTNAVTIHIPRISITSDKPNMGCKPLQLNFTETIDYDTDIDKFESRSWTLDDQEVSTDPSYFNSFEDVGIYNLQLTSVTQLGCIATASTEISVGQPQNPEFTVKDKTIFCASETVEFNDLSSNKEEINDVVWEFGDGEQSFFGLPFHQYVDTGYMDVKLKVYHNGCLSSITKEKAVYINGPVSKFNRIEICDSPFQAKFAIELTDAENYECDFGDGTIITSTTPTVSHEYATEGLYKVKITSNNSENGCSFTNKNNIYIAQSHALFDTINAIPCKNTLITFNPEISQGATEFLYNNQRKMYLWDFGDHSPFGFTNETVTHQYKSAGVYNAKLIINDINSCPDTITKEIVIYDPDPQFSVNYLEGCLPVKFKFTDESETENTIKHWLWNFGDGNTSIVQSPIHEFQNFGIYNVNLSITDEMGCQSQSTINQKIKATEPDASFKTTKTGTCINDSIEFFDTSISNIEQFTWNFGDGETSSFRNPKHAYKAKGIYDVSLHIIDDHGCELTKTLPAFVNVQEPPVAQFSSSNTNANCYPFLVNFYDESVSEHLGNYKWFFGDNLTGSSIKNPQHIYTKPDKYNVSLIAYTTNGCADTITKNEYVEIKGPYAEINLKDTACIYNNILYSLENKKNLSTIIWDFGDGSTSNDTLSYHTYNRKGKFYPNLILNTNSGFACRKVITDSIYISELTSDFTFSDDLNKGCIPFSPLIVNKSVKANNYLWKTSDNKESIEATPVFNFNTEGEKLITLITTDISGCEDTSSYSITAFPLPETTITADTFICRGSNISLLAEGGISYKWDHQSDLDNPDIDNPIAEPSYTTNYKVKVTDLHQCTSEDSVLVTVQQVPVVELNDSTIIIGETINLDISNPEIQNYSWTPESDISCSDCSTLTISPLETTAFNVTVTDTSNCFNVDYPYIVNVQKKFSVDIPTAFTPNGDGINDIVQVNGWGIKELVFLRIFNRFGQIIFESDNMDHGWDGSFRGKPQSSDIYNCVVKVRTYNDEFLEKKGNIKLIR